MLRLALFLLALSCGAVQAQPVGPVALYCDKVYQVSQGATALTKIVSGVAGKQISLCGWSINAGAAAGTFQLKSGTGTNCGTGTADVTPAFSLAINGVLVDHINTAALSIAAATDLCLVTTGTGPIQTTIYYTVQ